MEFEELDFFTAKEEIEGEGITDEEIAETAARLSGYVLESDDMSTAAALCLNMICRELLNIEQRLGAGYKPNYQQIMLERWTKLFEGVIKRLQGVSVGLVLEDVAVKYFDKNGRLDLSCLTENQPNTAENQPQEPSTDRARKAFAAAVKAGFMEKTDTGYKWIYNRGSKASLAYFLVKTYSPDNTSQTPFTALGVLFGVSRLDSHADQATQAKKEQKWRAKIDELLKGL